MPSASHPCVRSPSSRPFPARQVYEISVIYLRSSLDICELSPGPGLGTRLYLERSRANKCPNVLGQLAACKKVQQHLGKPGVMERLIGKEQASRVRERCMRMEGLGNEGGRLRKVLDASLQESVAAEDGKTREGTQEGPHRHERSVEAEAVLSKYVLKPIGAEGGGHCIFGSAIPSFYAGRIAPEGSQAGYVLMERIHQFVAL